MLRQPEGSGVEVRPGLPPAGCLPRFAPSGGGELAPARDSRGVCYLVRSEGVAMKIALVAACLAACTSSPSTMAGNDGPPDAPQSAPEGSAPEAGPAPQDGSKDAPGGRFRDAIVAPADARPDSPPEAGEEDSPGGSQAEGGTGDAAVENLGAGGAQGTGGEPGAGSSVASGGASSGGATGAGGACPESQKLCAGECVPMVANYGCGAKSCDPCPVPYRNVQYAVCSMSPGTLPVCGLREYRHACSGGRVYCNHEPPCVDPETCP